MTQIIITIISQRLIVTRKVIPAILRLVNFSTFIKATQLQMLRILLRKMLLSLKYHPILTTIPTIRLMHYKIRKSNPKKWTSLRLRVLDLNKKSNQLVQMATPKIPSEKLRMYRHTMMPSSEKAATKTPSPSSPTKSKTNQTVTSNPLPPKDHGLEQMATTYIRMVVRNISTISPHSKVLGEKSGSQYRKYEAVNVCPEDVKVRTNISKQFWQWMGWQQLDITSIVQPGGRHYEADNWGWRSPYRVERETARLLGVVMVIGVGQLLLSCSEVWVSVYIDGSEQSNNDGLKLKSLATTPLFIMVY